MKDLYSFSSSQAEHDKFYNEVAPAAYMRIYERLGIGDKTYKCFASGGYFSKYSLEFQTLSEVGEDTIYLDKAGKMAVNKEVYSDEVLAEHGFKKDALEEVRAVEVGNIFPLGSHYSDALGLYFTDDKGERKSIVMGCYGIGISRLMGLLAELFADDSGLVWPASVAPFSVYLIGIGEKAQKQADSLYTQLQKAGISVLYDDRDERPGEMFADADLFGIPARVVVSDKSLEAGGVELKMRAGGEPQIVKTDAVIQTLAKPLQA